jgi:hypothetical protein
MNPNKQARRGPGQAHRDALEGQTHHAAHDELRQVVRAEVRTVLKNMLALLDAPEGYSSRKGRGPEGYADEAWKDIASRIGTKRGRWYFVSAQRLAAYERGDRDPKPANDSPPTSTWHPSMIAARVGLRPVGGSR